MRILNKTPIVVARKKKLVLEQVEVSDYAAQGKSIARVDGKVIFVENTVPGDVVDVFVYKNKKDWGQGYVTRFHKKSEERVTPFCSHFGSCGGCQWQNLPYEKQAFYKHRETEENLRRIGHIELPPFRPIIGADQDKYYRNKLEFTFSSKRYLTLEQLRDENCSNDENVLGFHAKGLFDKIVDIDHCYLQADPSNALRLSVKKFAMENGFTFYDIKQHTGWLRNMQIRLCTTGEWMVNIIISREDEENRKKLLDHILKEFPQITSLLYTINPKVNDSIFDLNPIAYYGKGYVIEQLEDLKYKIGPKSFFQTNTKQGEKLYQVTRELAKLTGKENVYDLYCGTGSIGIFVSKLAAKVVGIELIPEAIADAKENAALNNIDNCTFYAGDVIHVCDDAFFARHGRPDVVITDPPRAGMHEKLVKKLLEIAAPRIVYVSCNPATQARDLQLLDEKYVVETVQPVDMFPHTHHIENVVSLVLRQP